MVGGFRYVDKMNFKYRKMPRVDSITGETEIIQRPKIEVIFRKYAETKSNDNPELRIFGLVDSGADVCFMPRQVADILKLDLDETKKKDSKSASGSFSTIPSEVHLEILYKNRRIVVGTVVVSVQVECADEGDVNNMILLGREGLFSMYEITFNEFKKTVHLKKIGGNKI